MTVQRYPFNKKTRQPGMIEHITPNLDLLGFNAFYAHGMCVNTVQVKRKIQRKEKSRHFLRS